MYGAGIGGGGRGRAQPGDHAPGVRRARPEVDKSEEGKAVKAIGKAVNTLTYDPSYFGMCLLYLPPIVQRRLYMGFAAWIEQLTRKHEQGLFLNDEDQSLCQDAAMLNRFLNP